MEDESEILKRYANKTNIGKDETITLASLKQQANKLTEEKKKEQRINFKIYSSDEAGQEKLDLQQYFCALCGKFIIATNIKLEVLPIRATDQAIAVDLQRVFVKHFLIKEGLKNIKREYGMEQQFRWKCHCDITIAYQSIRYDESEKIYEEMHIKRNKQFQGFQVSNKPFLYIINDAIVMEAKDSRLVKEILSKNPDLVY
ncbi:UPF0428 protein CXorf56-like protein, putative (macronuclear) [Tetrahymena thermophila SB210]|uniref:UPF0428 protein CXorf56-like protein, putative n=1 Tax=Tetrahymena thermophila (strain SB210) TaxID=312017 RepID=I7MJC4_TETTS|nr:UPF0428 protein CXorf56-like protein, putative [Tetrahymena thermophila SB210]EAS06146.1 UPF0428 protein CXorf56-like protein, putative [Tetrahymena thermophila SB210]|eukprot:XP_001026391.1 UPF0428 protein CXorf56-like protein, putative [Tetrahymena thermophila SB210]